MTGAYLKCLREDLGLGIVEFARRLGYVEASANTVSVRFREMERGKRAVTVGVARRARALMRSTAAAAVMRRAGYD